MSVLLQRMALTAPPAAAAVVARAAMTRPLRLRPSPCLATSAVAAAWSRACSMCPRRSSARAATAGEASAATVAAGAVPAAATPVAPHVDDPRSSLGGNSATTLHTDAATATAASHPFSSVAAAAAAPAPAAASAPVLDSVHLHGMRFFSYHGVYAEETRAGQPFEVDLTLQLDLSAAARADELAHTVDYSRAHALVARIVAGPPHYYLLEALSLRLIVALMRSFPAVQSVRVALRKPHVAMPGLLDYSGVTMERRREQVHKELQQQEEEEEQGQQQEEQGKEVGKKDTNATTLASESGKPIRARAAS